jgi:hypothetical protein
MEKKYYNLVIAVLAVAVVVLFILAISGKSSTTGDAIWDFLKAKKAEKVESTGGGIPNANAYYSFGKEVQVSENALVFETSNLHIKIVDGENFIGGIAENGKEYYFKESYFKEMSSEANNMGEPAMAKNGNKVVILSACTCVKTEEEIIYIGGSCPHPSLELYCLSTLCDGEYECHAGGPLNQE